MESRRIMDFLLLIFTCIIPPSLTQDRITVFLWLLIAILKLAIFFSLLPDTCPEIFFQSQDYSVMQCERVIT